MTTAIGYARVSSEHQEDGVSLDAQRSAIAAHCAAQGWTVGGVFVDVASARTLDRPGLRAALQALAERDAPALVVVKLDRLTRSVRDLGELLAGPLDVEHGGAQLVAVRDSIDTSSAGGRLVLHVLCTVAQWEREAVAERTREALAHLRRSGVALGAPPFGWRAAKGDDGRRQLVPDDDEQVTLHAIRALHRLGFNASRIARELDSQGRTPRSGRQWSPQSVLRILARDAAAMGAAVTT